VIVGYQQHESLDFILGAFKSVLRTNTFLLLLKFEEIKRQIHSEKKERK
jgi:hypothetical protein